MQLWVESGELAAATAESLQSCLTLSDPMDCSPPGSSVHGIFQARGLEWGATAFSWRTSIQSLSHEVAKCNGSDDSCSLRDARAPTFLKWKY